MRRVVRKRGAHCKSAARTAKARRALLKRDTQSQCAMRRANARHTERRAVRSKRATSKAKARRAKQKRDAQSQCGTCKAGGDEQSKCATSKANARRVKQHATQQSKNAHFGRLPHGLWVVVCSMIAPVCAPAPSASRSSSFCTARRAKDRLAQNESRFQVPA